jgi:hypothetical protein
VGQAAGIGLSSVRERTHEYAVRRACGFTQARVFGLVLLGQRPDRVDRFGVALVVAYLVTSGALPGIHDDSCDRSTDVQRGHRAARRAGPAVAVRRVDVATLSR